MTRIINKIQLNRPTFKLQHTKSALNEVVNDYVDNLPKDERKVLKEELTYNLPFKDDFISRIGEISLMFCALVKNNEQLFNRLAINFINRKYTQNIHIVKMYKFFMSSEEVLKGLIKGSLIEIYGEDASKNACSGILSILEKYNINYELQTNLHYNSSNNTPLKI